MRIKKIILNNIRSYENQEFNFGEGSTLLAGDIGSGKTSILLGIEFALFGLQPGQRGSAILRNGSVTGGVSIEFEVDNNNVLIERTMKRGKSVSQDYAAITINGDKEELSVTELKNRVLNLLDYPKEFSKKQNILYKFTVYTPQEEMKQIILQDAETRINTLRHVFGIDKYKKVIENSSIVLNKVKEEKKYKEGLVSTLDQDKSQLVARETELLTKKDSLDEFEKDFNFKKSFREACQVELDKVSEKIKEKDKLQQEIEKTKMMVSTKNNSMHDNQKMIQQLNLQIQELERLGFNQEKLNSLENEIPLLKQKMPEMNEKNLKISTEINTLMSKNIDHEKIKDKIKHLESCPTCLQEVDSVYKSNVEIKMDSEISSNINQVKELDLEKQKLSQEISKLNYDISLKEKEFQDLRILKVKIESIQEKKIHINDLEKNNASIATDMGFLNNQIISLEAGIFELNKYDGVFQEKQRELIEAQQQERIAEIKVAELKREIEFFSKNIEELKLKIQQTEQIKSQLYYLVGIEQWISKQFIPLISNIERNVMIKLKQDFSNLFSEWFSMLVSESFNVRLDDDFTPIVEQQDYEIDYAYLSGGERTAIALAYRLALNQVINSMLSKIKTRDLVILDEPTDGFSDQQLDKMREVLDQLNIGQLIIVSHEQKIEGFVDNVIRLKKEKGLSGIVE
jgi:DNA repair protein SbcC/Rad50